MDISSRTITPRGTQKGETSKAIMTPRGLSVDILSTVNSGESKKFMTQNDGQ